MKREDVESETFECVWDALEDTPEMAANMRLRSSILIALGQEIRSWDLTQVRAAKRLGVTQPRLNDLLRGKIENFSLDALAELAARAGLVLDLQISRAA